MYKNIESMKTPVKDLIFAVHLRVLTLKIACLRCDPLIPNYKEFLDNEL